MTVLQLQYQEWRLFIELKFLIFIPKTTTLRGLRQNYVVTTCFQPWFFFFLNPRELTKTQQTFLIPKITNTHIISARNFPYGSLTPPCCAEQRPNVRAHLTGSLLELRECNASSDVLMIQNWTQVYTQSGDVRINGLVHLTRNVLRTSKVSAEGACFNTGSSSRFHNKGVSAM